MINLCVVSNSHAASLKGGWDAVQGIFPDVSVRFFAAPNRGMAHVQLNKESGIYSAKSPAITEMLNMTSAGLDQIEVDHYDVFLIHGLFLDLPRLDLRLSEAVKVAAVSETINNSINFRFVRELSGFTKAPVYFSSSPMPTSDGRDSSVSSAYHSYGETSGEVRAFYGDLRAEMLLQPEETLEVSGLTKERYSIGSTRLTEDQEPHLPSEVNHMNDEFGAVFMGNFIPKIQQAVNGVSAV